MNIRCFLFYFLILIAYNCKNQNKYLTKITGEQLLISDSLVPNKEVDSFIAPYKNHVQKGLDEVLAYSKDTYIKSNGYLNTAIGNVLVDGLYEMANPIFKSRTGNNIDMVLLNHGSMRTFIPKGNITLKTVYEIMPFENSIVVVKMKGTQIDSLIAYLCKSKLAHPISKLKLKIDKDFKVLEATINGKPILATKTYYVATNDYLYFGGDNMTFFQPSDSLYILDYKIRNAFIDYFKKVDTISPVIDDRFIQTN